MNATWRYGASVVQSLCGSEKSPGMYQLAPKLAGSEQSRPLRSSTKDLVSSPENIKSAKSRSGGKIVLSYRLWWWKWKSLVAPSYPTHASQASSADHTLSARLG